MNIKLFIVIVGVLGIVSGIFFWQLGRTEKAVAPTGEVPAQPADALADPENGPLTGRGDMATLLALGRDLECSVVHEDVEHSLSTEGSVFLSGGKVRGDFLTGTLGTTSDKTVTSMIMRDEMVYVWATIDGDTWGMKSSLTSGAEASDTPQLDRREPLALDTEVRYDCKPWRPVDASVFALPSDVLFRDLSTIMEQGMEYGTTFEGEAMPGGANNPCAACALVADEDARDACEQNFQCAVPN